MRMTHLGETIRREGEPEGAQHIVLTRSGLLDLKEAIGGLLALVGLEALIRQFGADGATEGAVLKGLILMEDADEATLIALRQLHQSFHDLLSEGAIVDIVDKVAHAIENDQFGLSKPDGRLQKWEALLPLTDTQIEDTREAGLWAREGF